MSKHHRVRTYHWRLGRLEVKDAFFDNLEQALTFANNVENADSIKVFDHNDELTHNVVSASTESYA